jgi:hypothetical protein
LLVAPSQTTPTARTDRKRLHWLIPSSVFWLARDSLCSSLCRAEPVGVVKRHHQPARWRLPDTFRADHSRFHGQEMPLRRPGEAPIAVTMPRLLGSEAGPAADRGFGRRGGSGNLAVVSPLACVGYSLKAGRLPYNRYSREKTKNQSHTTATRCCRRLSYILPMILALAVEVVVPA